MDLLSVFRLRFRRAPASDGRRERRLARGGGVTIVFAFSIVPLLLMSAGVMEYNVAAKAKTSMKNAADSAAVFALNAASQRIKNDQDDWDEKASGLGRNAFLSNIKTNGNISISPPTIRITRSNNELTARVSYNGTYRTTVLRMVGLNSVAIGGSVEATVKMPLYTDVHIVIDNSGSMGIGATPADQIKMVDAVGCAFACHQDNIYGQRDNVPAIRATGATLRLDVVKNAVRTALGVVKVSPGAAQVRIAVYTLSNSLTKTYGPSSNIDGAIAAIDAIDIANADGQTGTNITQSLKELTSALSTTGRGYSAGEPRGVVMLATDAVQNIWMAKYSSGPGSLYKMVRDPHFKSFEPLKSFPDQLENVTLEGMDPSECTPVKNKGYVLMTLNMPYVTPPTGIDPGKQGMFDFINASLLTSIPSNMSSCATSAGNSFVANSPTEINDAISKMFENVGALPLRLAR